MPGQYQSCFFFLFLVSKQVLASFYGISLAFSADVSPYVTMLICSYNVLSFFFMLAYSNCISLVFFPLISMLVCLLIWFSYLSYSFAFQLFFVLQQVFE